MHWYLCYIQFKLKKKKKKCKKGLWSLNTEQNLLCYLHVFSLHDISSLVSLSLCTFQGASSYLEEYNSHSVTVLVSAQVRLMWRINVNCVRCICITGWFFSELYLCSAVISPITPSCRSPPPTSAPSRLVTCQYFAALFFLRLSLFHQCLETGWLSDPFRLSEEKAVRNKTLCILVKVRGAEGAGGGEPTLREMTRNLSAHACSLCRGMGPVGAHGMWGSGRGTQNH